MSDESSLLQAILEAPGDDAPRLIFADWLEENGQAERAEFIRVQCDLARLESLPENQSNGWVIWREQTESLRLREQELLLGGNAEAKYPEYPFTNRCRWFEPYRRDCESRDGHWGWEWHRGFVEEIRLSWKPWLSLHDSLLAETPLRKVVLTEWPNDLLISTNQLWALMDHSNIREYMARSPRFSDMESVLFTPYGMNIGQVSEPDWPIPPMPDSFNRGTLAVWLLACQWPKLEFRIDPQYGPSPLRNAWPDYQRMMDEMTEQIVRGFGIPAELLYGDD